MIPEGLYGGQSTASDENNQYLASLTQDTGGLSLADMQNTPYMLDRLAERQKSIEAYYNRGKDSLLGSIIKPFIDATLNTATGGMFGAAKAGLTGGDLTDALKSIALSQIGNAVGDRIAAGTEFGINPFGEQAGMLAEQVSGMGDVYSFLPSFAGSTSEQLIRGKSLEDALLAGLGTGVQSMEFPSGASFDWQTPQFLKDIDKAVIRPAGEALSSFDKAVLQPVTKPIAEGAEALYEAQKPIGQAVGDALEPLYEAQKPVGQAIADIGSELADTFDFLEDLNWVSLFGDSAIELGLGSGTGQAASDELVSATQFEDVYTEPEIQEAELFATRNYLEGLI